MFHTISTRDLQRTPKKVLDEAKKRNKPLIIITDNKPAGAIISINLLEELNQMLTLKVLEQEAMEEYKNGNVEIINSVAQDKNSVFSLAGAMKVEDADRMEKTIRSLKKVPARKP